MSCGVSNEFKRFSVELQEEGSPRYPIQRDLRRRKTFLGEVLVRLQETSGTLRIASEGFV